MARYDFDLFVIGGGSGGVRCARIAAGHGARVGIAEEWHWGGTCVNVGCVPKKIMVNAAEYGAWAGDARAFGWDVARGGHDWAALAAARDAEVGRLSGLYRGILEAAGVTPFEARATFLDPHTLQVGDRRVTAARIVVAVGGVPARPGIPGEELGLVSDDVFTLETRPERLVIVGSGYIALEFANVFHGLGSEVSILYRGDLPLRGFDQDIRRELCEAMERQGIRQVRPCQAARIDRRGGDLVVTTAGGEAVAGDAVLLATGRRPKVAGLNLEAAGVAVNGAGAVVVDEDQATPVPHVFAIGDVTDRLNLTPIATAVGHALADTLFGDRPRRVGYRDVPTAVFSSPPVATVGLSEADAALLGPVDVYVTRFTPMRHAISGRGVRTLMKLVVCQATRRVLGAHMLGEDAAEILQGVAVAVTAGATKEDFDRTIGIHPTAAEEFVTLRTRTREAGAPPAARAAE